MKGVSNMKKLKMRSSSANWEKDELLQGEKDAYNERYTS